MAVALRYFTDFAAEWPLMSKWLKLDPYCFSKNVA